MNTARVRVSDCLKFIYLKASAELERYHRARDTNEVSLEILATEILHFLRGNIQRQARRVYEEKSPPLDFWSKDKRVLSLRNRLEDYSDYGTSASLMERAINDTRSLMELAKRKERKWEKFETYAHYILPWRGFRVILKDISKDKAEKMLGFIYEMLKVFEERGFDQLIYESIRRIVLMHSHKKSETLKAEYYSGEDRSILLFDSLLSMGELDVGYDFKRNTTMYALVHEIGHWVHLDYLPKEAKEEWDRPWQGVNTDDPDYSPYNYNQLEPLKVPTMYGLTNVKEDFAETFAWFFLDPNSLHPVARKRMETVLKMAQDGGRRLMRRARSIHTPFHPHYFRR